MPVPYMGLFGILHDFFDRLAGAPARALLFVMVWFFIRQGYIFRLDSVRRGPYWLSGALSMQ